MQISFDTSTINPAELNALAALLASLAGRLPAAAPQTVSNLVVKVGADTSELDAAIDKAKTAADMGLVPVIEDDVPPPPTAGEDDVVRTEEEARNAAGLTEPADAPELDADGIPWDERIHASTKTKTQAGVWTKKRKVDEVLYGQVHAELQEQYAAEGKDEDVPPPPATSAENAPTDEQDVPPPPAPDASGGFSEFPELVQAVSGFGLPYVKLAELAGTVSDGKIVKFPDLRGHPELWDDFFALAQSAA